MRMVDLIQKKRDGYSLSEEEIQYIVDGYTNDAIPDYQMSAFLMSGYFNGFNDEETIALTMAMANSGERLDLSAVKGITVDKHSTGGVGDKTSLIVCPMVASLGVPIAKMSGRGLGHTGGTLDKLESIPGFNVSMSAENFIRQVNDIHFALIGQTADLAPADKKIYALRDVTATVDNMSLIASSIMSKKIASGAERIVLDVKTGSGAFMKDEEDAISLAREMVNIGKLADRNVTAIITDMNQPLGKAVGNALEIREVIDSLKGNGPEDLMEVCMTLASHMLILGEKAETPEEAETLLAETIANGKALEKFREFIEAQGGDSAVIEQYELLPLAPVQKEVTARESGYICSLQAGQIGMAETRLGGGRLNKTDQVDHSVGIYFYKKFGNYVEKGDKVAVIYARDEQSAEEASSIVNNAYDYSENKAGRIELVKRVIRQEEIVDEYNRKYN